MYTTRKTPTAPTVAPPQATPDTGGSAAESRKASTRGLGYDAGAATLRPPPPATANQTPAERARAVLAQHGLPPELIPKSTTAFTFDPAAKTFELRLAAPISLPIEGEGITLTIDSKVTGTLGAGKLLNIQGISGKKGWFSASVSEMQAAGDNVVVKHSMGQATVPRSVLAQIAEL